ncbi:MAG TPA: hypothetical protein VEP90_22500, partial [Methylomirabilota bacterium]|nr:hypothetical protein [Methylomirabilota bacterium]
EEVKRKLKLQSNGLPQLYIDYDCHDLIRQMQGLQFKRGIADRNAKEAQLDRDDHGPDALRYFMVEFFILGGGVNLSSFYDSSLLGSEAETFFRMKKGLSMETRVGF